MILADSLKIQLHAQSRMKNDDIDSQILRVNILPLGIKGQEKRQGNCGIYQQTRKDRVPHPEREQTLSAELHSIDRHSFCPWWKTPLTCFSESVLNGQIIHAAGVPYGWMTEYFDYLTDNGTDGALRKC